MDHLRRTAHVSVPYKERVLIWGGYRENIPERANIYYPSEELWSFCPLTKAWELKICHLSLNSQPPRMSGATASVMWDYMYLFGGYSQNVEGSHNQLYRLNLLSYTWEALYPSAVCYPLAVDKTVSWTYAGRFYTFGGFGSPSSNTSQHPAFEFVYDNVLWKGWTNQFYEYDPEEDTWNVPDFDGILPQARAAHAAAIVKHQVFIFGGRHDLRRTNDLHCLDMSNMQWSGELPIEGPIPQGRSWHSLTGLKDSMLILYGGFSEGHEALGECWMFIISTLKWQPVELPFFKPRIWHSACLSVFGEVVICGGCSSNILDMQRRPEQANEIIVIETSPKSLFRICLDRVTMLPEFFQSWSSLPQNIQTILQAQQSAARGTNLDGS